MPVGVLSHVCVYHMGAVPMEVRRRHQILQNWSEHLVVRSYVGTGNPTWILWK